MDEREVEKMDIPEPGRVLDEAFRVLRPGGFFQFSLLHPCFITPHLRWVRDAGGRKVVREVGRYFDRLPGEIEEWTFGGVADAIRRSVPPFRVPRFHLTLAELLNRLCEAGFVLERAGEPYPSDRVVHAHPVLMDERIVPSFLHLRCRKR